MDTTKTDSITDDTTAHAQAMGAEFLTAGQSQVMWRAAPRQRRPLNASAGTANRTPIAVRSASTETRSAVHATSSPGASSPGAATPPDSDRDPDAQSTSASGPDSSLQHVASTALRLVAEITCALRPAHQSMRWTTASSYGWLERAHARAASLAARGSAVLSVAIIGVHAQCIDTATLECCATVLVRRNGAIKARALAVCLRQRRGTWWVTHIEW